jgi:Glutamate-cysteine ligase
VTPATWIRKFVRTHPAYKFDSVVTQEINYDLLKAVDEMLVHFFICLSRSPDSIPTLIVKGESDKPQTYYLVNFTLIGRRNRGFIEIQV